MTARRPTFRLLDRYVGWSGLPEGLEGLDAADGIRLARTRPGAVDPDGLARWLPPRRVAWGYARDRWFVITARGLLRWSPTTRRFEAPGAEAAALRGGTAVAARRHRVAVSRLLADEVVLFAREGRDLVGRVPIERPGPVVVRPDGSVWVCDRRAGVIRRYDPSGRPLGRLPMPLPPGRAEALRVAVDASLWILTREADGAHRVWWCPMGGQAFVPATDELARTVLDRTRLASAGRGGFALEACHADGGMVALRFGWDAEPLGDRELCGARPPVREARGQLLIGPIDSGRPRCVWHRVRLDALRPTGTGIRVEVATAEQPLPVRPCPAASGDPDWLGFTAGPPHADDWQSSDALDLLVDQPPGRYLYLRVRLVGDGSATPSIRRIRLDFPRVTSMAHLPAVWRRDPIAEEFTERYLSLFDAGIEDTDLAYVRSAALLDPRRVPAPVLQWLAGFLDVHFDPAWSDEQRRAIVRAIPGLYRRRGTPWALREALSLTLGTVPAIDDRAGASSWGALDRTARLGGVHLFGRHRARLTLDASRLGRAALTSHGAPVHDARLANAHRIRIALPAETVRRIGRARIEHAIQAQKPAHTQASLRVGHTFFVVGSASMVGIDTLLQTPPRPILGGPLGNVRLRRETVIRPPREGRPAGLDLGHGALARVGGRIG